jgi:membrane protein YdbS with pleckstrin-like domain
VLPEPSPGRSEPTEPDAVGPVEPCGTRGFPADGRYRRLDPRYVRCARLSGLLATLALALLGPLVLSALAWLGETSASRLFGYGALWGALSLALVVRTLAWPQRKFRHLAWRLSPVGLEIRRGVCSRHRILVPRDRVQHTDVSRGPLERRFGLATLVVNTAGSHDNRIALEGLAHGTALAVRDFLIQGSAADGA